MIKSLVFLSNYFNHHQQPISEEFFDRLGGSYLFIETEPMDEERKKMGWEMRRKPEYVVSFEQFFERKDFYLKLILDAGVVIVGSAPNALVKKRIDEGKIVFRYSERPLKKGMELWKYPVRYLKWHKENPKGKNIYMLCASAYTAADYAKFGLFKGKCFKWGYFPRVDKYDNIDRLILNKKAMSILWVARFIDWKHPEIPIEIARRLKEDGYSFELKLIGEGDERPRLKMLAAEKELLDRVEFLDFMSPKAVRKKMEEASIFMFTSDQNEGWGAVLNEAMNSGCAVVADRKIGAAPFLIRQDENGILYDTTEELYQKVKYLLEHPECCENMGKKAYLTISQEWCAPKAVDRFLKLADSICEAGHEVDLYQEGICSFAELV